MTEDAKQVWKEMKEIGWSSAPKDFHLEYFENIIKAAKKALSIGGSSNLLNADELITGLGEPAENNEYILKPDSNGVWWIEHKHVGSGEPLKQWLTDKPFEQTDRKK